MLVDRGRVAHALARRDRSSSPLLVWMKDISPDIQWLHRPFDPD